MIGNVVMSLVSSDTSHVHDLLVRYWFHVAAMYWSPYRPSYRQLQKFSGPDVHGEEVGGRVLLEAGIIQKPTLAQ